MSFDLLIFCVYFEAIHHIYTNLKKLNRCCWKNMSFLRLGGGINAVCIALQYHWMAVNPSRWGL